MLETSIIWCETAHFAGLGAQTYVVRAAQVTRLCRCKDVWGMWDLTQPFRSLPGHPRGTQELRARTCSKGHSYLSPFPFPIQIHTGFVYSTLFLTLSPILEAWVSSAHKFVCAASWWEEGDGWYLFWLNCSVVFGRAFQQQWLSRLWAYLRVSHQVIVAAGRGEEKCFESCSAFPDGSQTQGQGLLGVAESI